MVNEENLSQPSDAFVQSIDVHTLLPQQEPFVMIDRLTHFDTRRVTTQTLVRADNIFVEDGAMTAFGLTENIAQTCAARIGYVNTHIRKQGIQIGFIGAVRNLVVESLPTVGETFSTEVEILEEVFGMVLARAECKLQAPQPTEGGECRTLATTEIKIAIRES